MRYLPFEVPAGVTRITIHREYDNGARGPKNTVDFGLFDNRGTEKGFRGWQGGSPGDFVITGDPATCSPHAVPGPLPAGRWSIAQYYLAAIPAGLTYKYTVLFSFDGPKPPRSFPAPPAYTPVIVRPGPGWFAGNLHMHSLHSDGSRPFSELVGRCAEAGFDFAVSTEHNSPTAAFDFPAAAQAHPGLLLMYGDEFTSPGGHAGILGITPGAWFDFRIDPEDGKLPAVIEAAHRQGALFVVNHPFAACTSCLWRYPFVEWRAADAIEVWNSNWTSDDRAVVDLWDTLLRSGARYRAFGGSDYHRGDDALSPATFVYAENLSTPAILDGLRKGHVFLSESPKGPHLLLSTPLSPAALPGDTVTVSANTAEIEVEARITGGSDGAFLRFVHAGGEMRLPIPSGQETATLHARIPLPQNRPALYVRAELIRGGGLTGPEKVIALTNPLYIVRDTPNPAAVK